MNQEGGSRTNAKRRKEQRTSCYYLTKSGYTKKELALKLGICPASLYNKLKKPETFTIFEFRKLIDLMQLEENEILMVV